MNLLPIVLFALGVIFLIWALKTENTLKATSPEMLATLKGLAAVKRELSQVQKALREAHSQMGDHELRLLRNENVQAEIRSTLQAQSSSMSHNIYHPPAPLVQNPSPSFIAIQGNSRKTQALPEKYRWALELHEQGWSAAEIAGHLAISQDAVNMVLRTSQRGGCA
jgi:hypothetical protein